MPTRQQEFAAQLALANAGDADAQYATANKYWEGIVFPKTASRDTPGL